jgi:hypothetical protein
MVVQLDLDGASFVRNTSQAKGALKKLGGDFELSKRQAAGFAQEGLGAIATISPRVANALADIAARSTAGMQALQLLGKAAVGVGLFMAAMDLGQRIRDLAEFGETADAAAERLKQATETETKFLQERSAAIKGLIGLQQERLTAEGELAAALARARGDEIGATLAVLRTKLQTLGLEDAARRRQITESVKDHEARAQQLITLEETTAARRLAIQTELARQREATELAIIKKIQETEKAAVDATERIRTAAVGAAKALGIETSIFQGFQEVDQLTKDVEGFSKGIEDFAKKGVDHRDLFKTIGDVQAAVDEKVRGLNERFKEQPAVLERIKTAVQGLEFGGLADRLDETVRQIQGLSEGAATSIETIHGAFEGATSGADSFNETIALKTPAAMQAGQGAVRAFTGEIATLNAWVRATEADVRNLISALSVALVRGQ